MVGPLEILNHEFVDEFQHQHAMIDARILWFRMPQYSHFLDLEAARRDPDFSCPTILNLDSYLYIEIQIRTMPLTSVYDKCTVGHRVVVEIIHGVDDRQHRCNTNRVEQPIRCGASA